MWVDPQSEPLSSLSSSCTERLEMMEEGGFSASIMIRSGNRRLVLVGPAACRGLTLPELLGPTTADDMAGPTGAVTEKTENQSYVVVKGKWERQKEKERKKW